MDLISIRRKMMGQGRRIRVVWNQIQHPFSTEFYRPYNSSNTSLEDISDGIVKQTWTGGTGGGYSYSTRHKENKPTVRTDHIYYISYMINPSVARGFGIEFAGGFAQLLKDCSANTWTRLSIVHEGVRNGPGLGYFGNKRSGAEMSIGDYVLLKSPIYIDLTQMFGSGNEPDLETFEKQCAKNGIDLTQSYPQDLDGTFRKWIV